MLSLLHHILSYFMLLYSVLFYYILFCHGHNNSVYLHYKLNSFLSHLFGTCFTHSVRKLCYFSTSQNSLKDNGHNCFIKRAQFIFLSQACMGITFTQDQRMCKHSKMHLRKCYISLNRYYLWLTFCVVWP